MMRFVMWFTFGLLTSYYMYGKQSKVPIVKCVIISLFGFISFFLWLLYCWVKGQEIDSLLPDKTDTK